MSLSHRVTEILEKAFSQNTNSIKVTNLDPTDPLFVVALAVIEGTTTLTAQANLNDRVISVADATGITAGTYIALFNLATNRFYAGFVVSVNVLDLTIDSPIDSTFEIGDLVGFGTDQMNVDGSITPVIFTLRGADPGLDVTIDVTRIIFTCTTENTVDLSRFGDIVGGLTNGMVMRQVNGITNNIFNIKTNGDIANIMYDWTPFDTNNIQHGRNGFVARLTFSGQEKMGAVIRVKPGENIEFIIQDDLSTLLTFSIIAEGHITGEDEA